MDHKSDIITYLECVTHLVDKHNNSKLKYPCLEAFILRNGQDMQYQPLPNNINRGKMKMCFKNAYDTALQHGYDYVEGYAIGVIPMLHAWCVDKNLNVIDPTWEDGACYFGVIFPMNYVNSIILRRKRWGVMDAFELGYPLLQGEKWRG